jgi:G3E family GTPase
VRGDLVRILGDLRERREAGEISFERVIIETTGLADPGPVAQTFFIDDDVAEYYLLDAVITVVDARHGDQQLTEHKEAVEQVGFADRILMSKVDLVGEPEQKALIGRLQRINPRAPIKPVHFGNVPIDEVLDIRGFNLNAVLELTPDFLTSDEHEHDDAVTSFIFKSDKPFNATKLEDFLGGIVQVYGPDMLRYKGVLFVKGSERQMVFQGVHQMMGADLGRRWQPGEKPTSKMVFIGRKLPKDMFIQGLQQCLA